MAEVTDPVVRSDRLDRKILAIPEDRVFTKRTVIMGFAVITYLLIVLIVLVLRVTSSTNEAVTQEIPSLKDQVADREGTIATQEDLLRQSVDAIVMLQQTLRDKGIEPPEVIIRPTTSTTLED